MSGGADRVLEALREAGTALCSGEDLSRRLAVSRAQVWKHVGTLRRRGYRIDGAPGDGYRLTGIPDRLYPEEIRHGLETRWLGRDIRHFESVDSTNRIASELAAAGAEAGTAVVAEAQTAGRGRLGRSFYSPPFVNLYASLVLRPEIELARAPALVLTAAAAVAEAVAGTLQAEGGGSAKDVEIKWPNDVLLGGLKTSGILMELSAETDRVAFLVLGIGVNLNVERDSFPDEFRHLATSLRSHCARAVDRLAFTRRLFVRLEQVLDDHARGGFAAVRPRFEAFFRMPGRRVGIRDMGGHEWYGLARGIAPDGALEVENQEGAIVRVIAADVTLAKDAG